MIKSLRLSNMCKASKRFCKILNTHTIKTSSQETNKSVDEKTNGKKIALRVLLFNKTVTSEEIYKPKIIAFAEDRLIEWRCGYLIFPGSWPDMIIILIRHLRVNNDISYSSCSQTEIRNCSIGAVWKKRDMFSVL